MKQKILIIAAVIVVLAGVGLYWLTLPSAEAPPPSVTDTEGELESSPTTVEAAIKERVTTKATLQAYKAQLAIYEKVLQHAPQNAEAQRKVNVLRQTIEELEKQSAPH